MMIHMKFDQDCPSSFIEIYIFEIPMGPNAKIDKGR